MNRLYLAKLAQAEKVAGVSILKLLVLALVKFVAGTLTGVTILYTSALKTFTTALSIFAAYIGVKASQKTADKHFEYGYYKIETFAAFLASIFILYIGEKILVENINHILNPEDSHYGIFAILTLIVTIGFSWNFSQKLEKAGKEANIDSLSVSAKYKKIDLLASAAIVLGAFTVLFGIPYVEPILSGGIAIYIVIISLRAFKNSLFSLLDYWADTGLVKSVKVILQANSHIIQKIESVKFRQAGPLIFGEAILQINPFANTKDVRNTLDNAKNHILKLSPYLQSFSIFSRIICPENTILAIPVKKSNGLKSPLAHIWSEMKHLVLVKIKHNKMHLKAVLDYDNFVDHQALVSVLVKNKVNVLISSAVDSLMYYSLERVNQIQIYPAFTNAKTLEDAAKLFTIDN